MVHFRVDCHIIICLLYKKWKLLTHIITLSESTVDFFGATLIVLRKRAGELRPIAVGQTLCHMVAKCILQHAMHTLGVDLAPQQLGYGVPLEGEAAAHAARLYFNNMSPGNLRLKLERVQLFAMRQNAGCSERLLQSFSSSLFQLMQIHQCCTVVTTSSCLLKEHSKMIHSAHCCFV